MLQRSRCYGLRPLLTTLSVADLGEGLGGGHPRRPSPPLFWVKKEEITEGRKGGWARKLKPGPAP